MNGVFRICLLFDINEQIEIPNLKSFQVEGCNKLTTLFVSNIHGRLFESNIEELIVSDALNLRYFLALKEGVVHGDVPLQFLFPKLTTLKLKHLPKLNCFYPSKHVVEGPKLKSLELWDCGVNDYEEGAETQQPIYLLNQAFSCVEELKLSGGVIRMCPENLVKKIKFLVVNMNETEVLPLNCNIQKFQNLETLFLTQGDPTLYTDWAMEDTMSHREGKTLGLYALSEMNFVGDLIFQNFDFQRLVAYKCDWWIQLTQPSAWLQNLTTLIVSFDYDYKLETLITSSMAENLRKLKIMIANQCWRLKEIVEDSVHLQNLQVLRVSSCRKLNYLISPSASFPNLTILVVCFCFNSIKILTPTVVQSLPKLEMLEVRDCGSVREIMTNEGDEMETIVFHSLKTLKFTFLSGLVCFCSGDFRLEFPLLEQLRIRNCPRMNNLYTGHLIVPRLQEVEINFRTFELSREIDVNTLLSSSQELI